MRSFVDDLPDGNDRVAGGSDAGRRTPTGLAELDDLTGGIRLGDLWVISGRSGVGKTVLALGFARSAAFGHGTPATFVTGRETERDLTVLALCAEARVSLRHLQPGTPTDDEQVRLARRMSEIENGPLFVIETGPDRRAARTAVTMAVAVTALSHRAAQIIVLDELDSPDLSLDLRNLKALAVQEGVAVVAVLADAPKRRARERDAARIADLVLRIDRDHDQDPMQSPSPRIGEADLIVLRNRRGPIAVVTVAFQGHFGRFVNMRL